MEGGGHMYYQVNYFHIKNGRHLNESFVVDVELSENPNYEEEQAVFLPLIKQHAGHTNVKLMSYSEL